jgi:hypothetical protein
MVISGAAQQGITPVLRAAFEAIQKAREEAGS